MTGPMIRGWCPGALRPMASGDGLVVRVRPPVAMLTPTQAAGLADLAQAQGSGVLQLTNRANIQIRGVTEAGLGAVQAGLLALGLLDGGIAADAEARLNILVAPGWQGAAGWDVPDLWSRLRRALVSADAPRLPGKFGFALDMGAGGAMLARESADIRFERARSGIAVSADGAGTARVMADAAGAVALAMDIARWFAASGGVGPDGRGRMRDHLARGAVLPADLAGDAVPGDVAQPPALVGFDFGLIPATSLHRLAGLIPGPLHLTPWRAFHVTGLRDGAALRDDPAFLIARDDPRQRRFACTGAPGCPQGWGEPRRMALDLGLLPPPGRTLHISGCAKGCAHPGPADLTLTFTEGGIAVIPQGRAADAPLRLVSPADLRGIFKDWADAAHI